jgi:hypothetical protein
VAAKVGFDVVVADTVNHALRSVQLETGEVGTVAGTGRQRSGRDTPPAFATGATPSALTDLSSPWDVVWDPGRGAVLIAMAGIHQLWALDLEKGLVGVVAGTGNEGLADGPALKAWLAQPSGLAVDGQGRCWFADSETSALRALDPRGVIATVVGEGLFDFGHVDGPGGAARLQHPLGVAVVGQTEVAVADTYNGAVRVYDTVTDQLRTVATGLQEPSDVLLCPGSDGRELLVVESTAHRVTRVALDSDARPVAPEHLRTTRPPLDVHPGRVPLRVAFTVPEGRKLDTSFGSPIQLDISATPADLLVEGSGLSDQLTRDLVLAPGQGVLHVSARVATCDTQSEFPACHLNSQDWGVPVQVASSAAEAGSGIVLPLG